MKRKFSELAKVEFVGSLDESFGRYSQVGAHLARQWAFELEMAAGDSQAAMESLRGHPLLFGLDARVKARRVAKRLKRANELASGIATEFERFHRSYKRNFPECTHAVRDELQEAHDQRAESETVEDYIVVEPQKRSRAYATAERLDQEPTRHRIFLAIES